jgi:hypothetical protein
MRSPVNSSVAERSGGSVEVVDVDVDVVEKAGAVEVLEGADELGAVHVGIVVGTVCSSSPPHPARTPSKNTLDRNTAAVNTPRTRKPYVLASAGGRRPAPTNKPRAAIAQHRPTSPGQPSPSTDQQANGGHRPAPTNKPRTLR